MLKYAFQNKILKNAFKICFKSFKNILNILKYEEKKKIWPKYTINQHGINAIKIFQSLFKNML